MWATIKLEGCCCGRPQKTQRIEALRESLHFFERMRREISQKLSQIQIYSISLIYKYNENIHSYSFH